MVAVSVTTKQEKRLPRHAVREMQAEVATTDLSD
jgi:hypothetical protein